MDNILVSIIIPTYNFGQYLQETIHSVKNQTFTDWECIIVDDGSTDNTKKIVNNFKETDNRFKYVFQENKGVSAARNNGIKNAIGDFIQFLDSDDLLQPDKIQNQINYFRNFPNVDIVYSNFQHFKNGEKPAYIKGEYLEQNKVSMRGQALVKLFLKGDFIRTSTPLYRKSVIEDVGFFTEQFISLEDWDFWIRCAYLEKYFAFNESENANTFVRINPNGLSKDLITMKKFYLPVLQHTFVKGKLNLYNKISLLSRYSMIYIDSILKQNNKIIFLNKRKNLFLFLISSYSILFFPVYLSIQILRLAKK